MPSPMENVPPVMLYTPVVAVAIFKSRPVRAASVAAAFGAPNVTEPPLIVKLAAAWRSNALLPAVALTDAC